MSDGPGQAARHEDVASYALGVLDDAGMSRFEEHLAGCEACAVQLESFLPVVGLLPEVRLSTVDLGPRPIGADDELRSRRRRRADRRTPAAGAARLVTAARAGLHRPAIAAAAAAVVAAAATASLYGEFGPEEIGPTAATAAATSQTPWNGLRGPDLENGEQLRATDPTTGVKAEAVLDRAPWGTRVSFALSHLQGPLRCRLVVTRRDGSTEVVSSWLVPAEGYGTAAQGRPLVLQAATAVDRADITGLRVESLGPAGPTTLVTVPS